MAREYLIRLPWPPQKASPNGPQGNWRGKASAGAEYKAACSILCTQQHIRSIDYTPHVVITFYPTRNGRFDLDNMLARCKRGLDAVADAIGVDDGDWVSIDLRRGDPIKGGGVLVHVMPVGR